MTIIAAKTAAALAAIGVTALAGPVSAQDVRIRNAVARVVVMVEDRSDVDIEIVRGAAALPPLTVRREGDRLVVDGDLRNAVRDCRSGPSDARQPGEGASVDIRRLGRISLSDAPLIVIHSPRDVSVDASGAVFGTVGRGSRSVDLGNGGCGDWIVANTTGKMSLAVAGSGSIRAGGSRELEASIGGSGSISTGSTGKVEANIGGSGDIVIGRIDGPADLAIGGSGDIAVRNGTTPRLNVAIGGSGDVSFDGVAEDLDVAIAGSGDVRVTRATGRISRAVVGSGELRIGR